MAWFLGNNKKKYLEKLKKANQEREEKASIKAIGDISPEQKEQRARKVEIAKEEKKLEEAREKRKEEDKATEDQLLIVNGAKIKMGSHMGSFKVLSDVPTTQGKLTGTVVEKSPANFTFNDGFQLLSLTEWQDVGTIKYQDNKVLIKKSKIIATGKMPGNTPPETAPIEFIDSGQINVVESIDTDGMPVPSYENPDFNIKIELVDTKTFVPFGIPDFKGNKENDCIQFKCKIIGSAVDSIEWEISDEEVIYKETVLPELIVSSGKSKREEIKQKENIGVGEYLLSWDGFDNNDIYDSTRLNNKRLKVKITAIKGEQKQTDEIEIKPKYSVVEWVDVKIDKKNKRIDTTLRVNLKDGGARGLECEDIYISPNPTIHHTPICPWDKIPKEVIEKNKKEPIKSRTKNFEDLKELAIRGIEKYWSRNKYNIGKGIKIEGDFYEIFTNAVNLDHPKKSLDDIPLIYNTNNEWSRSGNTGGSYSDYNLDDNFMDLIPDHGIVQRISYNVGYIKHNWTNDKYDGWRYYFDDENDSFYNAIFEFMETVAHEIGHEILQAYGNTVYSWQHKGTSYYFPQDTKPTEENESFLDKVLHLDFMKNTHGENYPKYGEVDLMKYYNYNLSQRNRIIADEKDVKSLIFLTKLKIK
ncbi:hypothetical protein [Bergeyella sp. RCAD1439]|uniref:hypothetical protein n=1 Tax=Bergeyella anatis TaxID=3113737 RepID=UPI002E180F47|nr:hypothetical protein [Bergeyella sp. RCAD1439]